MKSTRKNNKKKLRKKENTLPNCISKERKICIFLLLLSFFIPKCNKKGVFFKCSVINIKIFSSYISLIKKFEHNYTLLYILIYSNTFFIN